MPAGLAMREPSLRSRSAAPAPPTADGDRLVELVYDELRVLAGRALRRERKGHTLQATALVHEAYLALADAAARGWNDAAHFRSTAAAVIRRILVDSMAVDR